MTTVPATETAGRPTESHRAPTSYPGCLILRDPGYAVQTRAASVRPGRTLDQARATSQMR